MGLLAEMIFEVPSVRRRLFDMGPR